MLVEFLVIHVSTVFLVFGVIRVSTVFLVFGEHSGHMDHTELHKHKEYSGHTDHMNLWDSDYLFTPCQQTLPDLTS